MRAALAGVKTYFEAGEPQVPVVVEVRSMEELNEALAASKRENLLLERLLLDNFSPSAVEIAVKHVAGQVALEASGGIDLDNLRAYGEAGVDFVSMGALTHSVKSLDLSLKTTSSLQG